MHNSFFLTSILTYVLVQKIDISLYMYSCFWWCSQSFHSFETYKLPGISCAISINSQEQYYAANSDQDFQFSRSADKILKFQRDFKLSSLPELSVLNNLWRGILDKVYVERNACILARVLIGICKCKIKKIKIEFYLKVVYLFKYLMSGSVEHVPCL